MRLSRRTLLGTGVVLAAARVDAGKDAGAASTVTPVCSDRMPEIPPERQTDAQKKASAEFMAGRGMAVFGPFVPLLRSPQVMLRAKAMGDYLRFNSSLPPKLNEFAILLTARHWSQAYEWAIHQPLALKAGLSPDAAAMVAEGSRPTRLDDGEQLIYDFLTELLTHQSVSDGSYQAVVARFGEQGAIDLVGVCGYYTFLAMVLNVARTSLPKNPSAKLEPFICTG